MTIPNTLSPFFANFEAVSASTLRSSGAQAQGLVSEDVPHLTSLTLRRMVRLFHPVSHQFMKDTFDAAVAQPARCYADWTNPFDELWPVRVKDKLVVDGTPYLVTGVKNTPGLFMTLFIDLEIE